MRKITDALGTGTYTLCRRISYRQNKVFLTKYKATLRQQGHNLKSFKNISKILHYEITVRFFIKYEQKLTQVLHWHEWKQFLVFKTYVI